MKCTARLSEISPWNVLVAPLLLLRCFLCIPGYFVETEMQYPYAEHERVHMTAAPEIGAGVGAPRYKRDTGMPCMIGHKTVVAEHTRFISEI